MENKNNYENSRKILEDSIIRLMMEKNLSARALSKEIWMNDWYITRMLNGKIDPSFRSCLYCSIFAESSTSGK